MGAAFGDFEEGNRTGDGVDGDVVVFENVGGAVDDGGGPLPGRPPSGGPLPPVGPSPTELAVGYEVLESTRFCWVGPGEAG